MVEFYDLAVIGGGINGCGVARDAAGRGASVYLCEMNDLASGTSSQSTKLIHGGLRYLENLEFRLVHEALAEREALWRIAPHIVEPMRFILPYHHSHRPAWLMRFGLFLYDYTGGRRLLPPTKTLDLETDPAGRPLIPEKFYYGFEYSDCCVDDARLVVLNAMDAVRRGAVIETRTTAVAAERLPDHWRLEVENRRTGTRREIQAKALVNASGPWVNDTLANVVKTNAKSSVRLVQGSHIVVRRLYEHDRAYMLQNHDGRMIFTIPFERDFTLIGTTELDYSGDPGDAKAGNDEIAYLLDATSEYFTEPVGRRDVVWAYSGVRPLYDNGVGTPYAATRDYVIDADNPSGLAPLISIFGGKITTYRRLAEAVLWRLGGDIRALRDRSGWTGDTALPGGDMPMDGLPAFVDTLRRSYPFLAPATAERLARTYGTETRMFLGSAARLADLGQDFGHGLTEAELRYLMAHEWAHTVDDVLWRRTKLGLRMSEDDIARIAAFMEPMANEGGAVAVDTGLPEMEVVASAPASETVAMETGPDPALTDAPPPEPDAFTVEPDAVANNTHEVTSLTPPEIMSAALEEEPAEIVPPAATATVAASMPSEPVAAMIVASVNMAARSSKGKKAKKGKRGNKRNGR